VCFDEAFDVFHASILGLFRSHLDKSPDAQGASGLGIKSITARAQTAQDEHIFRPLLAGR
jgi:hypothetical protein